MLKIAPLTAMIVTVALGPALAAPPGCLQEIDNLTVEFDVPAAQSISATQTGSAYYVPPPPAGEITVPPPPTTTPPGRPGAPHGMAGGSMGQPMLAAHDRLNAAQHAKLQALLQQARGVEALGNEQRCFDVLGEARELTKAQPAPAAPAKKTRAPRPSPSG